MDPLTRLHGYVGRKSLGDRGLVPRIWVRRQYNTELYQNYRDSGRPGQRGQVTPLPLKFGAEVRNCIWRLWRTGVKVMVSELSNLSYTCLTISKTPRGEHHCRPIICYMIKLDVWSWYSVARIPLFRLGLYASGDNAGACRALTVVIISGYFLPYKVVGEYPHQPLCTCQLV